MQPISDQIRTPQLASTRVYVVRLGHLAMIKTNMSDADLWIQRRGSEANVGKPISRGLVQGFNPENIGIKVTSTHLLLPEYLYFVMEHLWRSGMWRQLYGSLPLKHIRVHDVRNVTLQLQSPEGGSGPLGPEDPWGGGIVLMALGLASALLTGTLVWS